MKREQNSRFHAHNGLKRLALKQGYTKNQISDLTKDTAETLGLNT